MPKFVNENTLRPCVKCGRIAYPDLRVGYLAEEWRISIQCEICGNRKLLIVSGGQMSYPGKDVLDLIDAWNKENEEKEEGVNNGNKTEH